MQGAQTGNRNLGAVGKQVVVKAMKTEGVAN